MTHCYSKIKSIVADTTFKTFCNISRRSFNDCMVVINISIPLPLTSGVPWKLSKANKSNNNNHYQFNMLRKLSKGQIIVTIHEFSFFAIHNRKVTFLHSKNNESVALLFSSKESLSESNCSVKLHKEISFNNNGLSN